MKVVLLAIVLCTTSCAGQFVDEMQVYEKECLGEDVFPCMSGGCIQQSQYCDGKVDCDDGTDENYCLDHKPDAQFCNETHQFMCRDSKKCIPNHWICNNDIDCDDGSDELNCTLVPVATGKCKGFLCGDGKCISSLWLCDGSYDCKDKSDENSPENCRHSLLSHSMLSGSDCPEWLGGRRQYKCTDSSFCLPSEMMCDGMQDCKDGSDERPFCANWHTMCANHTCLGDKASCVPDRAGPTCECLNHLNLRRYNTSTGACDDIDECALARPQCSHYCVNADGHFTCECADGYFKDELKYLCYATGPEPLLFYSTRNEIKYLKVKSKEVVTLATGIKKAHGVTSNGIYVYWVETAEGHQAIVKAHIDDVENTRQVIVGLGLEDPGDIAIDFMARHIYFGDAERGLIFVCYDSGFKCFTLKADTKHPKFITLDPVHGKMYWADWHSRPVIMRAKMDGSSSEVLVESMTSFASGLALDVPNDRLYFVDKTIKVVLLSTKVVYSLFKEAHHHPYAISVFENTVYWSDWISDSIQTTDKIHSSSQRQVLLKMDTSVFGLHMYHPALMKKIPHPCDEHPCSHFCLVTSIDTYSCACPDEMENKNGRCIPKDDYRPLHLIVGSGRLFTKFRLDAMGNPHSHVTNFSLGRVQAMTYDSVRDRLYVYDGREHSISYTNMSDFTHGKVFALIKFGPENVVDMDYDYVSDSLYMLDSGSGYIEVLSLRTLHRAVVYRFTDRETPVSFCVLPHYGKMLVAVMQTDNDNRIYVDSIGLDGDGRRHIVTVNIRGPRIILRFLHGMDNVYLADEGNGIIDYLHPEGTGRENFRELSTSISSMAVTENYIFWTDRRTPKLYWANIHETSHKIRRIELRAFSNSSQLLLQTTYPPPSPHDPLTQHPCHRDNPCSQVCVPTHSPTNPYSYKCLCSPGLVFSNGRCTEVARCSESEIYCHKSNICVEKHKRCNGVVDCSRGEDEEGCTHVTKKSESQCNPNEILCYELCVAKDSPSPCSPEKHSDITKKPKSQCDPNEILCYELCVAKDSPSPCSPKNHSDITKKPESQCDPNEILCYGLCVAKDSPSPCSPEKHSDITKQPESQCEPNEILCYGLCVAKDSPSPCSPATHSVVADLTTPPPLKCDWIQFSCKESPVCISRSLLCDGAKDCPDGSDEGPDNCDTLACFDTEFMCASGSCILKTWKCDGDQDCNDASDEIDCESVSCKPGYYQCRDRECIELKKRCDGHQDCFDYSDEEECDEPVVVEEPKIHRCAEWEYSCERNRSICLPITARCNMKTDCPGGTDEIGCDYRCTPHGMFGCKQQIRCLAMNRVCDGNKECDDGSDETPDACALVNRTSHLYPVMLYPAAECRDGFLCGNGQCIEWAEVCDRTPNCFDGSDESIHCFSACDNNTCAHACQATPLGPRCLCPAGYSAAPDRRTCADVDECRAGLCSQACVNTPGSFLCSCHHGYALRSDRRSCKAVTGNMSILYVSGNTVRSVSADGYGAIEYSDPDLGDITDLDFNVRTKRLYVTSTESGKLIELNVTHDVVAVTNVGRPTRVAVDWVTGNVYFADSTPGASCVRVCDVTRRRCARLQKIPSDATVKALIVEPASRRMFYCVQRGHESVVWSASLSGRSALDLLHVTQCSGLAADSFTRRLYVAETAPPHIMVVDFDGKNPKKILTERPQLQAPHALALFEDHIYYLVGDSYRLGRCLLHGPKNCETYIYRVFDANTFVIRHESIQRDDLVNECAAHDCSNVCVLEKAPVCVCDDGHVRDDGNCDPSNKNELPLFNGWTYQDYQRGHRASITVVIAVLVLFLVYIALFIYYHFVYKPKRKRSTAYTEVRFQNSSDEAAQLSCSPAVQMNGNQLINGNEFVNPLQYVRNVWQQSIRRKPRPVCTAGLSIAVPNSPQQDFSDTESDLDDRETKRFIRKNKFLN
uniref:EGF-like domain-containing protein n=1 Tax=Bombyx mori TaxID=7091 RepID=A0A8R2M4J1_BOMMO|nr:vitellogenin receptor isoform X33 [Bombyx mori]